MKNVLFPFFCLLFCCSAVAQTSLNVELFGQVKRMDDRYSGSWSYIAADGSEYALIGAMSGTAVYQIDEAQNIQEVGFVSGPSTRWREITTIGHHAFVVTDVMDDPHSMQVIDLSYLPDSVSLIASYDATFTKGHIIQRDIYSDSAYVYVNGTSTTEGVHILDVSDPMQPVEVGLYQPGYYIHDCHVNGDWLFGAAFYEGTIDVVDISNKRQPVLLTRFEVPGGSVHSSWLTEDKRYLVVCLEKDGLPSRIFDVSNLDDITEVATFTANDSALVHNPYIKGDICYYSHNTEGLRVVDIADPELPVEVGYYDTWPGQSGGFKGLWSACPFFPSGKIIGGNRHDGLYIWIFDGTRAGRVYGVVKDEISGELINDPEVIFQPSGEQLSIDLQGEFKAGALAGSYSVEVSAAGYEARELAFSLNEGDSLWLEILLKPIVDGVADEHPLPALRIFPNPAKGLALIELQAIPEAHTLSLYDPSGRKLAKYPIRGQSHFTLHREELPAGSYRIFMLDIEQNVLARGQLIFQ